MSLVYLAFRRLLELCSLRLCSPEFKELEIVVLRHHLRCFAARLGGLSCADAIGVLGRCKPPSSALQLALLLRRARDAAALASRASRAARARAQQRAVQYARPPLELR